MEKQCSLCKKVKPYSEFYSYNYNKLTARCKACYRAQSSKNYARKPQTTKKVKNYKDYLEDAGLVDYYNRTTDYRRYM